MPYRRAPFNFCRQRIKFRTSKWIENELPKTYNDQVYPQLPFMIRSKAWRIKSKIDNNPAGQLYNYTFKVSELIRDERIVLNYNKAVEIRTHVERLIVEAMRNGDRHRPTMALANFWLREKNLIHKLFKVLVPRYSEYATAFTAIHMLGKDYEKYGLTMTQLEQWHGCRYRFGEAVLELRGNNLPPITRPKLNRPGLLGNVLIDGARESMRQQLPSTN